MTRQANGACENIDAGRRWQNHDREGCVVRARDGLGTAVMAAGGKRQEGCNLDLIKVLILSTLRSSERARKRGRSELCEAAAELRRNTKMGIKAESSLFESSRVALLQEGCVPWYGASLVVSWCRCGCGLFAGLAEERRGLAAGGV